MQYIGICANEKRRLESLHKQRGVSLLEKYNIVGTPGVGFGPSGEGYFRLTAFGDRDNTIEAMKRLNSYQIKLSAYLIKLLNQVGTFAL